MRNRLAHLGTFLAVALVPAAAWLSCPDRAAAQQAGQKQPVKSASPNFVIPPADLAIMKALDSKVSFSVKLQPMREVLDLLEEKSRGNLNIIVDSPGFKENLVDEPVFLNDPVTKDFSKLPLKNRAVLKLILGERPPGFGYYIEDGVLYIAPTAKVNKKLIPKNYPVANLVGGDRLVKAALSELQTAKLGPKGEIIVGPNGQMLNKNIDGLMNLIKGNVEPDHWKNPDGSGGPATMTFVPASASLQINCSLEVHYLLMSSGLLGNIQGAARPRSKKDLQTVTVKTYSVAGLIDPENPGSGKAELQAALNLLTGDSDKPGTTPSFSILAHAELVVVRQSLEMHQRIERWLIDLSDVGKLDGIGQVVVLNLSRTQVTDAGLKELAEVSSLEFLNLRRAQITDVGLRELARLKSLQSLNLSNTAVTGTGLTGMTSLRWLNLADTRVSDVGLKEVGGLKELEYLNLRGAQITDTGLRELAGLKLLRTLDLVGTSAREDGKGALDLRFLVTDAAVAELRKALPRLNIIR